MLDSILELLTGSLSGLTDNLFAIGLALFTVALGFFGIYYLGKRRQMVHQERMASIIKGLHYAGVAPQVFKKPAPDPREHTRRGLKWLFGGLGLSGALYGYATLDPAAAAADEAVRGALIGIIPGFMGLAELLFSWMCKRRHQRENDIFRSRLMYRAAARRY